VHEHRIADLTGNTPNVMHYIKNISYMIYKNNNSI